MKTFPLQSLTIIEAQQKQFTLVDSICRHFPGAEFLTSGDLGLTPGLNQPRITQRVEQVLADAFHAPAAALVQGAGTGAIRAALAALLKPGQRLLVHDAPVYPTTRVIIEQMGLTLITADFNDLSALKQVVDEQQPDAALVQHTRQQPQDSYVLADVLATLRAAGVPALTDDNYAVMKVARIGCECGANVSTFSCFKLFGPEGVGAVVGDADVINRIRATLYSGGSQIQGSQALEVLRGLVFAPVMHAVQAGVSERLLALLNGGAVAEVKSAVIANAQSVQSRNMRSRRSFTVFPERFARRIRNSNIARFALTQIAAVKRRYCGSCVKVLPAFNRGKRYLRKECRNKSALG